MTAYEQVKAARQTGRATGLTFIQGVFDGFFELHGDRRYADDPAVVGGLARLEGRPVTVIALERGQDTKDKVRRNFGGARPEGYRKAQRLMTQAEKFGRPVVCFVDTAGAACDMGAEERGQGQAIAESLMQMMALKVPVISIFIGEGGSGGALALAVANRVWMLEHAVYSVISPEGCASILWKDASKVEQAANCLHMTAQDLLEQGVADRVFLEDGLEQEELCQILREALAEALDQDCALSGEELARQRYQRFRSYGARQEGGEE